MTTATISRTEVMNAAWAKVQDYRARGYANTLADLRARLSYELRQAWAAAKLAVSKAAVAKAMQAASPAQKAAADLSMLQNKDRWTDADRQEADRLYAIIHGADAEDYAEKRDLIASAGGRICSVTFIKADGSERTMKVQPAALKFRVKGDAASDSAQRAVATRAARHPNLLNVWDVEAKAPRSINLATVQAITVDGMAHAYA